MYLRVSINQFQFIHQVTAKVVTWQGDSEKNYVVIMSAATSPSKHEFALYKENSSSVHHSTKVLYSKRQDKASKYTGILTSSTSDDIDV